jgi:tRNA pseudouridine38-40 synthase
MSPTDKQSPFSSLAFDYERVNTARGSRPLPPSGHRNIKLEISYDGRAFSGYQYQPHARTVQETLTQAWTQLTGEHVLLFGCSRLDANVSANHFVLNLYSQTQHSCDRILRSLNGIMQTSLKAPISIYTCTDVEPKFHARFDSIGKHYRYLVWYGRGHHALLGPHSWQVRSNVAPQNIDRILKIFEGKHNFAAFRAQDCTATTTERTIHRVDTWIHPRLPELTVLDFWGDGFLKNMIRNIVGTVLDVATQKKQESVILDAFEHGNRALVGQCAPAHALALERVYYSQPEYDTDAQNGIRLFLS